MSSITDAWGYFEFNPNFYFDNMNAINNYMYQAMATEHGLFDFIKKATDSKFYFTATGKNGFLDDIPDALNELGVGNETRHTALYNKLYQARTAIHFTYNDYSHDDREWLSVDCTVSPTGINSLIQSDIDLEVSNIAIKQNPTDNRSLILADIEDGIIFDKNKPNYKLGIQDFIRDYIEPAIKIPQDCVDLSDKNDFYQTIITLLDDYTQNDSICNGALLLEDFETPADMLDLINKALTAKIKG